MLKSMTMRSTLAAVACALSFSAYAIADPPRQVNIPAGDLIPALEVLEKQAAIELVFQPQQLKAFHTGGVTGTYEPKDAVKILLKGLPLELRTDSTGAMVIVLPGAKLTASALAAAGPASGDSSGESLRLAQANAGQTSGAASVSGQQTSKAQQTSEPVALQEVIVTAEKRAERLQDVPIQVSVLSGKDLDSSSYSGVSEALSSVAGVSVNTPYFGGGTEVVIRGVSAGGLITYSGASPIAYYVDSVPFGLVKSAPAPDEDAYDLQRVEVLRGPQGTLYGATALNGVVRVLTNDADLNQFEFKARISDSGTDGGGNNYRGDMAVNVPIIDGKLAVRGVVGYQSDSGWIDSPVQTNVNNSEMKNYRLKVNSQPTENLAIGLSLWSSRDNQGAPSAGDANNRTTARPEPVSTDFDAYGVKVNYDLSGYTISSATSYLDYLNRLSLDFDVFAGGLPFQLQTQLRSDVFSEEFLVNSPSEGAWRWSVGSMYRKATEDSIQYATLFIEPIPNAGSNAPDSYTVSKSTAVFGNITRTFFDARLELTAGVRYFEDSVPQTTTSPHSATEYSKGTFEKTTPRAVVTWHSSETLMVYGSYSQGFRSGFPQVAGVALPPVNADTLTNYEVGTKGSAFDGQLNFEAAAYYMDWKNIQASLLVPGAFDPTCDCRVPVAGVVNGPSASGPGVDLFLSTHPVKELTLGISASWNRLEMDHDVISGGFVLYPEGSRLSESPETSVSGSANYLFHLGASGYKGWIEGSINYTSAQHIVSLVGVPVTSSGDVQLLGRASVGIEAPQHWTARLYADNIGNRQFFPLRFPYNDPNLDERNRPRTVGLQLEYKY